jgi:hypothetical protein
MGKKRTSGEIHCDDILQDTLSTANDIITFYEQVMAEQAAKLKQSEAENYYLRGSRVALLELVSCLLLKPAEGLRN